MKRLVLAGAGHAHARVLLDWARAPLPGVELVLVSPQPLAPYSGMVPGWLAGVYRHDEIVIDFAALARRARARWVAAELEALQTEPRALRLSDGTRLGCDLLSLNIGSTLRPPVAAAGARVLALRPLSALRDRYEALLADWVADPSSAPASVTAVGGGAAGVESLLAVLARLRGLRPDRRVEGRLVTRELQLLPALAPPARRAAAQALARAGVAVQLGGDGAAAASRPGEIVLWATGAEAHDWPRDPVRRGTLAVDAAGFVRVDAMLRSTSHPWLHAAGDCARVEPRPLPKAGVYAVRMGPVLSRNLRAALGDGRAAPYRPQREHLVLLATGDGRAIASRGARLGACGAWIWRWKDRIDRAFVRRHADAPGADRR